MAVALSSWCTNLIGVGVRVTRNDALGVHVETGLVIRGVGLRGDGGVSIILVSAHDPGRLSSIPLDDPNTLVEIIQGLGW